MAQPREGIRPTIVRGMWHSMMAAYHRSEGPFDPNYGRIRWRNGYASNHMGHFAFEPLPPWGLCACCGESEIPTMLPQISWCEDCEKMHWMMIARKIGWNRWDFISPYVLPFLMRDRDKGRRRMQLYRYLLDERPTTPQDNRPLWYLGGLEIWGLEESFQDVVEVFFHFRDKKHWRAFSRWKSLVYKLVHRILTDRLISVEKYLIDRIWLSA